MTTLLALALTMAATAPLPAAGPSASTSLSAQAETYATAAGDDLARIESRARHEITATRAARQPGGDSLTNGAIIGAAVAGGAMLLYVSRICRETSCAPDALMWTGLAAGVGALIGAGIDALFERAPFPRMRVRY